MFNNNQIKLYVYPVINEEVMDLEFRTTSDFWTASRSELDGMRYCTERMFSKGVSEEWKKQFEMWYELIKKHGIKEYSIEINTQCKVTIQK